MPTEPNSPFAPPSAYLADAPNLARGSPIKAVLLGLAVDIGGTILMSLLLGIGYGIFLAATGTPPAEIASAAKMDNPASLLSITGTVMGLIFSVLGGYVCARIAKHAEYRLAAIMAVLSSLLGFVMAGSRHSFQLTALLVIASFAATMIGARIGYQKNRQS
jgi:hypothetical protein